MSVPPHVQMLHLSNLNLVYLLGWILILCLSADKRLHSRSTTRNVFVGPWVHGRKFRVGYHTRGRWERMLNFPYAGIVPSSLYTFFCLSPFWGHWHKREKSISRWKPLGVLLGNTFVSGKNWLVQFYAIMDWNENTNFCEHRLCMLVF